MYGLKNVKNFKRPTVLIGLAATSVFLAATLISAINIKSYSVDMITNPNFYPRFTGDEAVNGFQFIAENYANKEKIFSIKTISSLPIKLEPTDTVHLLPKEKKVTDLFIKIPREIAEKNQLIDIDVNIVDEKGKVISKKITFRKPFGKKSGVKK